LPRLLIIRPIHPLPGRAAAALQWLSDTEPARKESGQVYQLVLRSVVDSNDYQFVQVWTDRDSYRRWRETPEREKLAQERQFYLTHDPARLYEVTS
jgi:hypothetical protein